MDRGQIHFPPKREPLRDEVHALGALMGEILREQGGAELFTLVELDRVSPRSAAAAARRVPEEAWERRQRAVERDIVVIASGNNEARESSLGEVHRVFLCWLFKDDPLAPRLGNLDPGVGRLWRSRRRSGGHALPAAGANPSPQLP